jgi:hypothetical protein
MHRSKPDATDVRLAASALPSRNSRFTADVEGQKVRLSANGAVAVTMEEEQSST